MLREKQRKQRKNRYAKFEVDKDFLIGRTDVEAETPILWPLMGKPDSFAPHFPNSSSQPLRLPGDPHPCLGCVWLRQGLSDSHSI